MEYTILTLDGITKVNGRPVKIAGFEKYSFFYRKDEDECFIISEVTTGMKLGGCAWGTLKQARRAVGMLLTENKEQFIKYIEGAA